MRLFNLFLKKIFDYLFAIILFFFLVPLFIIISLLIIFIEERPIFFTQFRAGQNGKRIKIIKFRTIGVNKYNKDKVSVFCKFLRLTRIDETPQIFNVLKGELSLVGPRPLYSKYTKLYNKKQLKRLEMKPGITGWAQVNEFDNITWKEKFDLDVWYYHNKTIFIDLLIILKTLIKIIKSFFIKNQFSSKMSKFRGYKYD